MAAAELGACQRAIPTPMKADQCPRPSVHAVAVRLAHLDEELHHAPRGIEPLGEKREVIHRAEDLPAGGAPELIRGRSLARSLPARQKSSPSWNSSMAQYTMLTRNSSVPDNRAADTTSDDVVIPASRAIWSSETTRRWSSQ